MRVTYEEGRTISGREKCKLLKQIRKEIAEANGIEYLTSECTYEGNCSGTCPKCDAELRHLDAELNRRAALGWNITLTGLSLDTFFTTEKHWSKAAPDTPISELLLSAESQKCLINAGINTLEKLASLPRDELYALNHMNEKCFEDIMRTLDSLGFLLTGDLGGGIDLMGESRPIDERDLFGLDGEMWW